MEWVDWINAPIEQKTGVVGGSITSNAAVRIDAKSVANNSVRAASGPAGTSPLALGLDESIAPLAGSAYGRQALAAAGPKAQIDPAPRLGRSIDIAPAAPRVVNGARAGTVAAPLPTNGLYRIAPEPSKPYLVQTDARFTSYANFLSSDWMLQRLGIDPGKTQKRLGDGFYEQRLVQNQVTGLTGKRFLAGYASAEDEYIALMTNGLATAQRFGLEPGIALTDAQMEALTANMVWLVSETVTLPDGSRQTMLAPQVYLARNAVLTPTGALIEGETVAMRTGELDNTRGTVRGELLAAIQADGAIDNDGGSLLGGDLAIRARSISSATLVDAHSAAGKDGVSTVSGVSALSRIEATGNMLIDVDGLFSARGARIAAGKSGSLTAGTVRIAGINLANSAADTHGDIDPHAFPAEPQGWSLFSPDLLNPAQGSHYAIASTQNFGSTLSAGGSFTIFSNGSLDFLGSQASTGKGLIMAATGPVTIGAEIGHISTQAQARVPKYTYQQSMEADTASGSALRAGGDIRVLTGAQRDADGTIRFDPKAGNPAASLTVAGSSIQAGLDPSGQGAALLGATGKLDVGEAVLQGSYREESRNVIERRLTTSRLHELREGSGDGGVGSMIAGTTVSMVSGGDMRISGSSVGASGDVQLTAGGNIDIAASRHSETRHELRDDATSGLMVSGKGLLAGSREERDDGTANGAFESRTRSLVGSGTGTVSVAAIGDVNVRGSDLIAGDKVGIVGKNIAIAPGEDAIDSRQRHDVDESGLFITASGTLPTAVNAASGAVDRKSTGGDKRIAALQAAKAAMTMYKLSGAMSAGNAASSGGVTPGADMGTGGMSSAGKVNAMVGSTHSHSDNVGQMQTHSGSSVLARNGVSLTATGSGALDASGAAADGDIRIAGSQVSGRDIDLWAARDIRLEAVADRYSSRADGASSSFMVGIGYGAANGQYGLTIDAAASAGRGKGNTDSVVYRQSSVTASGALNLNSGRDTSILGAQANGETVRASIGRNLSIASTQDSELVDIAQTNGALNVSVCLPYVCYGNAVSVSGSVNTSSIAGDYLSVRQQSGIFAGQGGFDVAVKGKTELTDAVIASTATPEKNRLSTGTLVLNDQSNHAEYDSKNFGVSFSIGAGTTGKTGGDAGAANKPGAASDGGAADGGQGNEGATPGAPGNADKGKQQGGARALPIASVPGGEAVSGTTNSAIAAGDIRITARRVQ